MNIYVFFCIFYMYLFPYFYDFFPIFLTFSTYFWIWMSTRVKAVLNINTLGSQYNTGPSVTKWDSSGVSKGTLDMLGVTGQILSYLI